MDSIIEQAKLFAQSAHQGQKRKTGEPYFNHCQNVAKYLEKMGLDETTIAAAYLHDVAEDTPVKLEKIKKQFGTEIAQLVESVTKLGWVRIKKSWFPFPKLSQEQLSLYDRQIETLRKMMLAMSKDVRVLLIKLADRVDNLKTLYVLDQDKQERIARETLEIYSPLAYRLGMGEIKGTLEDLAFPYAYPQEYKELKKLVGKNYQKKEFYIQNIIKKIQKILKIEGINIISIHGRMKHFYSLYKKLQHYNMDLSRIYDLVAIRIIVPTVSDCYGVLGLLHSHWTPLPGRIKDYIAFPKPNGYQSLHTTVFCDKGKIVEIQIRTPQMHERAEWGIASHWHYSSLKTSQKPSKIKKLSKQDRTFIKEITQWQRSVKDPREWTEGLKLDFFQDRIFAFTPKGDVINLPTGATPVDFAFAIHSEVGKRCSGAIVNGKIEELSYPIQNGDMVEILISRSAKPHIDWLKFVKTSKAKGEIKNYLQ
jgi:GTP pyrophosphokinase